MNFDLYSAVYIMTNAFFTYTIFKFIRIFFDKLITNKVVEFISYIGYFVISSIIYFILYIPVALMLSNIILLLLITFNYNDTMKKRILSVLLIYLTLMCIEMAIVILTGYINFPLLRQSEFSSIFGIILIRCVSYVVALIMSGFKNIKAGVKIPTEYWLSVFFLPFSSIIILVILFGQGKLSPNLLFICITLIMLINITTFYLYDRIIMSTENKIEALLTSQQNKYFQKQIELMKSSMIGIRILRHDLKNQLSAIQSIAKMGDLPALTNHIDSLIGANDFLKNYADSGNIYIDSILNFKILEAEQAGIQTNLSLKIPSSLDVSSVDFCSILGNLIDNAIHASSKLDKSRKKMSINIRYDKNRFIIIVSNTYDGKLIYEGDKIISSHKNRREHGIGLTSVKNTVDKYDGIFNIEHSTDTFTVTIIITL